MIITRIIGGLGNQMFQYALARSLAARQGEEPFLDVTGFDSYKLHSYGLNQLRVVERLATAKMLARSPFRNWRPSFIFRRLHAKPRYRVVSESSFAFDERVPRLRGDLYLDGYWQSEKYFAEIRDVLLREFQPKEIGAKALGYKEAILAADNPVSVHVRRGDYVSNPRTNQVHGTCSPDYYRQAVAAVSEKAPRPHFFIFSDDSAWVKQNIVLGETVTYVEDNKNFEDLHLMSLCHHNVIANSSFSWWGAWLNDHADKIIVAPKKWFANENMDTRDLIPETWTRI